MPQITTITSEALQAQIRRLLPSQQGFGIDLEATNVVQPIIDITPAAEGSQLPSYLQTAYSFDSNTAIDVQETTVNYAVSPGFYRVTGICTIRADSTNSRAVSLLVRTAVTTKRIFGFLTLSGGINGEYLAERIDEYLFLQTGESFEISASTGCTVRGSFRQIADVNGNLINPIGFTFE